jgi:hypothetical protein
MTDIIGYMKTDYWLWFNQKPHHFPSLTVTFNVDGLVNKADAIDALDAWSAATGMNFIQAIGSDADIMFDDTFARADTSVEVSHGLTVQAHINVGASLLQQEYYFVHEIGHALGIGHPGPYNQGVPVKLFPDDDWNHSVMSYFSGGSLPPSRPMVDDVAAWHAIYDGPINVPTFERPTNLLIGGTGGVDGDWYKAQNLDVWRAGVDPAAHYAAYGWHEGRDPNAYFDTSWYLQRYTDVARAGVSPLEHYAQFGWREGRDSSELFDTSAYLAANPDVAAAGVNPLEHYLVFGLNEGRPSWLV